MKLILFNLNCQVSYEYWFPIHNELWKIMWIAILNFDWIHVSLIRVCREQAFINIFLHIIHSSVSTLILEKIHPKKHCENGRHSDWRRFRHWATKHGLHNWEWQAVEWKMAHWKIECCEKSPFKVKIFNSIFDRYSRSKRCFVVVIRKLNKRLVFFV